ncbi:MAG: hypothetical protein U0822_26100 [Anaerolineae bacterium]
MSSQSSPCHIRLTIKGILDESWSDYFRSLSIEPQRLTPGGPVTVIAGDLPDQSAFVGILNCVQGFNLTLLAVDYSAQSV